MVYLLIMYSQEDGEDNEEQVKEHDRAGEENRAIQDFMIYTISRNMQIKVL